MLLQSWVWEIISLEQILQSSSEINKLNKIGKSLVLIANSAVLHVLELRH